MWFSSLNPYYNLGAVLVEIPETKELKVYMGVSSSLLQEEDEKRIAELGCKIPINIAQSMFPQYKPELFIY